MWLSVLAVLLLVAALGLAASTGAQGPTCTPNANGSCGSANVALLPGGQDRGDSTQISSDDSAEAAVDFSVSCSYPAGYVPPQHDWGVGVEVYTQGKAIDGNSAAFGGGDSADTYGADSNPNDLAHPLPVTLSMDPDGPSRQTFEVRVILQCNGMNTTIDDKMFTICRLADTTSESGRDDIKREEGGFQKNEYSHDGPVHKSGPFAGQRNCTIGWGHLIHEGNCQCADLPDPSVTACDNKAEQPFYKGIDEKTGQKLFDKDIRTAENLFLRSAALPLNQCQVNALTDFFFNVGRAGRYSAAKKGGPSHGNTQLAVDLDDGDYAGVPAQILTFDKNTSNHKRREMDAAMFSGPCDGC